MWKKEIKFFEKSEFFVLGSIKSAPGSRDPYSQQSESGRFR